MRRVIFLFFLFYQVNTAIGIHLRNFTESKIGQAGLGNTYTNSVPESDLKDLQIGVWLENCRSIETVDNRCEWLGSSANLQDYKGVLQGMSINNTTASKLLQNKATNMGIGFNFLGDCKLTNLYCNTNENCWHGMYLEDVSTVISDQGTTSQSWNNKWTGNLDNKVDGSQLAGNPIKWYYKPADGPQFNPNPSQLFILPITASGNYPCTAPQGPMNNDEREAAFGGTVRDSTEDDPDSTYFKQAADESFYKIAKSNEAVLDLNVPVDQLYQAKFDELQAGNIGKYEEVVTAIDEGEKQIAIQKLSTIVDQNAVEQNKKYVAGVLASNYNVRLDADSDTIVALHAIAFTHPFYGGEAVYWSRAILHIDVKDQLPPMRRRNTTANNMPIGKTILGRLVPNPTSNNVNFVYPKLETDKIMLKLFDMYGNELSTVKCLSSQKVLSTENYQQGVYLLQVFVNGAMSETHRLTIIR
jgi:hypothetical protein